MFKYFDMIRGYVPEILIKEFVMKFKSSFYFCFVSRCIVYDHLFSWSKLFVATQALYAITMETKVRLQIKFLMLLMISYHLPEGILSSFA